VRAVHSAALKSVARARRGEGPSFLVCQTYRFHGHHVGDIDRAYYRSKAEEEEWKTQRDPITSLADWLKKNKLADHKAFAGIENEIATEVKEALNFALNAAYPDPSEVNQHVYA
jgi:pyruvate dehydrogenase E1 component alpha subunit